MLAAHGSFWALSASTPQPLQLGQAVPQVGLGADQSVAQLWVLGGKGLKEAQRFLQQRPRLIGLARLKARKAEAGQRAGEVGAAGGIGLAERPEPGDGFQQGRQGTLQLAVIPVGLAQADGTS